MSYLPGTCTVNESVFLPYLQLSLCHAYLVPGNQDGISYLYYDYVTDFTELFPIVIAATWF